MQFLSPCGVRNAKINFFVGNLEERDVFIEWTNNFFPMLEKRFFPRIFLGNEV